MAKRLTHRARKSNVGAVGTDRPAAPGERAHGSPHGSNVRRSYLTLTESDRLWCVVRVDLTELGFEERTTLVVCTDLSDAARELGAWAHGLGLPYRDYLSNRDEFVTSWPL